MPFQGLAYWYEKPTATWNCIQRADIVVLTTAKVATATRTGLGVISADGLVTDPDPTAGYGAGGYGAGLYGE